MFSNSGRPQASDAAGTTLALERLEAKGSAMKISGSGDDPFIGRMERALDVMSRRQQIVASNIGNVDTPGYRTKDIDFTASLERAVGSRGPGLAMRTTNAKHLQAASGGAGPETAKGVKGLTVRNDGNDVSIDREMLALAQTRGRFETTTTIARFRIKQLLAAIEDGRGA